MPRIEIILLATDGSPASTAATVHAIELATGLHARLLVMSVVSVPELTAMTAPFPDVLGDAQQEAETIVRGVVDHAREAGVEATYLIWEGRPGDAIMAAAESEHVDLIVVGSHGRSAVGRFFLGSVSEYVVRHAHVPVLVVRPPERQAEQV